jgi:hypothetical protein
LKTQRPYWWKTFVGGIVIAIGMGVLGAAISRYLGAPEYFGGTVGFCFAGLAGLFALAARIANKH